MARIGFLLILALAVGIAQPVHAQSTDSGFVYGAIIDLNVTGTWLNLDTLAALKFNTISCWATRERTDWSASLENLSRLGLRVWGTNQRSAELPDSEQGYIMWSLHKRSKARSLYSVWPADDTTAFGDPVILQLTHSIGRRTPDGWEAREGRDSSGSLQSGPGLWIGGGRPNQRRVNFVEYSLRLTDTTSLRPETPVCRLYGTHRSRGCQFTANPMYDTILHRRDFPAPGVWKRFLFRYQMAADSTALAADCKPTASANSMVDFHIDWFGLGGLESQWVRGMDSSGWELVLGPEELRRGPIKQQAAYFKDAPVTAWFGDESSWQTPYKAYAFFFVDSLIRMATDGHARLYTDLHIGNVNPESSWDYFMYASLRNGDRTFYPWVSPFREAYPWSHDLDSLQANCYDMVTHAVRHYVTDMIDTVPGTRWITNVQCFSDDPDPEGDPSPTANDVVCLSFIYLAHGATGLMYHRYDGGIWSNGDASWGLVYDYNGQQRTSRRYAAIRDRVTPLIIDRGWGDTLMTLRYRGAGPAANVRQILGSIVENVRSNKRPMYLELGFFTSKTGAADYVMIVNKRTTDHDPQQITLKLDPTRLANPGLSAYTVTDLRTGASRRISGARSEIDGIRIDPGDPAFFKIEGVVP